MSSQLPAVLLLLAGLGWLGLPGTLRRSTGLAGYGSLQPVFRAVLPGSVVGRLAALLSARVVAAFEGFVRTNR